MWILSSLGRPDRIREVIDGYEWGDERVILALAEKDEKLRDYLGCRYPFSWTTEIVPMLGNGPTYNEILRRYPDEACYGFLADDAILVTPMMLRGLEDEAGAWNIAYANDGHWGAQLPTMPCLGGELVRAVGYLAPPTLIHWAIDTAWGELGKRLECLRYREDLRYEHRNPVWGSAKDDSTYQSARANSVDWQRLLRAWMINDMPRAIERVKLSKGGSHATVLHAIAPTAAVPAERCSDR